MLFKNRFQRTEMLLGHDAMERLKSSRIAVFGIGGVGGHAAEALVRAGIGEIDLIDKDKVAFSNLNRQIIATEKTLGMSKVEAAKERFLSINPDIVINTHECFFLPENSNEFDFSKFDYVVDAIDTVSAKIALVLACEKVGTPLISSMGTGNKLDPTRLEVSDVFKTSVCPLARVMRTELKKRGIKKLKVVYSREEPQKISEERLHECLDEEEIGKKIPPASNSFVPGTAGLIIAAEVVKDIIKRT